MKIAITIWLLAFAALAVCGWLANVTISKDSSWIGTWLIIAAAAEFFIGGLVLLIVWMIWG